MIPLFEYVSPMKVRELIAKLQECNQDAEVWLGYEGVCDSAKSAEEYEGGTVVMILTGS